jgi:hypothetical protein
MKIKLDKEDCIEIARDISEYFDKESICTEICGLEIQVEYRLKKIGYVEDDYFNGTRAFVCNNIDFELSSIIPTYVDAEIDYSIKHIESELRRDLID